MPRRPDPSVLCTIDGCEKPSDTYGWCRKHYIRWYRHGDPLITKRMWGTPQERFWPNVEITGFCWLWTGAINRGGYGVFNSTEPDTLAHRLTYTWLVGEIPEGLQLDHLCRIRKCVNPDHLEPVTKPENIARGYWPSAVHARQTHCKRGHPFDEENTRITSSGSRMCRICDKIRQARRGKKKRARVCKYGHPYDEANTRVFPSGIRQCIICADLGRYGAQKMNRMTND